MARAVASTSFSASAFAVDGKATAKRNTEKNDKHCRDKFFKDYLLPKVKRVVAYAECISDDQAVTLRKPSPQHKQSPPSHPSGGGAGFSERQAASAALSAPHSRLGYLSPEEFIQTKILTP